MKAAFAPVDAPLVLDADLLALSDEDALAEAELDASAEELAAEEPPDPPQAARARHATAKHAITIAMSLARWFVLVSMNLPFPPRGLSLGLRLQFLR